MSTPQRPNRTFSILPAAILVFSALAGPTAAAGAETKSSVPAPSPQTLAVVTGTVLETIEASNYTYMRLKTPDGEIWAAVAKAKVEKGQNVTVVNAARMDGFESRTLNRKFDRIVFGSLGEPGAAAKGPEAAGPISVTKAEGPEGRTVAEVFKERSPLE